MDIDLLRSVLGWCSLINIGILLWWFGLIVFAKDWVYKMHSRWFKLSRAQFDALHYGGMGLFKLLTFFFFIVPYLVLRYAV